jgi:sugar lactone lactonase YvrE
MRSILCVVVAALLGTLSAGAAEVLRLRHAATLLADAEGVPLRWPQGVGCGLPGAILVADSGNGRVLKVEVSGALALVTGSVALPEIGYPVRVDGDASGNLVVLDGKKRALARVGADGSFQGWTDVPRVEGAAAPFVRAFALAPGGAVVVLDVAGGRVVRLDASGALERSIVLPAEARGAVDVAVDGRGSTFVLDGVGRRVFVARPGETAFVPLSGPLTEDLDFPGALEADPSGRLLVTDEHGGGVVILGPDGSFRGRQSAYGWKEGLLRYPSDLCSNGRGLLAIADRENQRVQVFTIGE